MLQAFVPRFVEAYKSLAIEDYGGDLDTIGCPGFAGAVDCTQHETASPGTVPVNGMTERRDPNGVIQKIFYNKFKGVHGVKSQVTTGVFAHRVGNHVLEVLGPCAPRRIGNRTRCPRSCALAPTAYLPWRST